MRSCRSARLATMLTTLEAVFGQFYIAVGIAQLVGGGYSRHLAAICYTLSLSAL